MCKISVIVPVFNCEKYIERCIKSVLSQTFLNFELIIVDDGSTDNSFTICQVYEKKDSRIKVIHQENYGVSSARNKGINESNGLYITFLDSDDWISEVYLERMIRIAEMNNADMVICKYKMINTYEKDIPSEDKVCTYNGKEAIHIHGMTMDGAFRSPTAKLTRSSIIREHLFPENRHYAEDAACVYLWMFECNVICETDEIHYYYYINPTSVIHHNYERKRLGAFNTYRELLAFYSNQCWWDLFNATLSIFLIEIISGLEISVLSHQPELTKDIKSILSQSIKEYLHISAEINVLYREDLVEYLEKNSMLRKKYVEDCVNSLVFSYRQSVYFEKEDVLRRIKHFIIKNHPSISQCSDAYYLIYPNFTNCYWKLNNLSKRLYRRLSK